jgi:hypothetical protein
VVEYEVTTPGVIVEVIVCNTHCGTTAVLATIVLIKGTTRRREVEIIDGVGVRVASVEAAGATNCGVAIGVVVIGLFVELAGATRSGIPGHFVTVTVTAPVIGVVIGVFSNAVGGVLITLADVSNATGVVDGTTGIEGVVVTGVTAGTKGVVSGVTDETSGAVADDTNGVVFGLTDDTKGAVTIGTKGVVTGGTTGAKGGATGTFCIVISIVIIEVEVLVVVQVIGILGKGVAFIAAVVGVVV